MLEEFFGRVEASSGVGREIANGLPNLGLALEGVRAVKWAKSWW